MFLAVLCLLVLFSTLLLLLATRFRSRMAALVAWIVGSIISGSRTQEKAPDEEKKSNSDEKSTRPKKSKPSAPSTKRPRSSEPPVSTNLPTQIEEVIKDTLKEEQRDHQKLKVRKRNKPKNKPKTVENKSDDIGFSFFKTGSLESIKLDQQIEQKPSFETTEPSETATQKVVDPIGFSFLPVKDRKNAKRAKKIDDLPVSTLISHYKKKTNNHQLVQEPIVEKKHVIPLGNKNELAPVGKKPENNSHESVLSGNKRDLIEIVNKQSGKTVYLEAKESKKVHSKVSYASVTSQQFDEKLLDQNNEEEAIKTESEIFIRREVQDIEQTNSAICSKPDALIEEEPVENPPESILFKIVEAPKPDAVHEHEETPSLPTSQQLDEKLLDQNNEEQAIKTESEIFIRREVQDIEQTNSAICSKPDALIEEEQSPEILKEEPVENLPEPILFAIVEAPKPEAIFEHEETPSLPTLESASFTNTSSDETITIFSRDNFENSSSEENFKMSTGGTQTRVLTLNDQEHQESTLYRIEKNWILQFRLGPSLLGRKINLYVNYPAECDDFSRSNYRLLNWLQDEGCENSDDTALHTQIQATRAGSFHYYFTYEDSETNEFQGSGFFLVDPELRYGKNEDLPLDCIQCQTVLAKSLGPFDTWQGKLQVAKETGYNMIHFTPIQELGGSNSSYSLSEQLKVNPLFNKQNGDQTSFADIESLIKTMRTEWKCTSICDIVLNHTANESQWLQEHPEVTYNCSNCPYMRPAYLLDACLHQFSLDVARGAYEEKGIPAREINTEDHLNAIRYHFHNEILASVNIPEMFVCDVPKYVTEFMNLARNKIAPAEASSAKSSEELKLIQDPLFRRLATSIDMDLALKLYNIYRKDCFDEETRIKRSVEEFKNRLDHLNSEITREIQADLSAAVENCLAGIRYFRVQADGPRIKDVSVKNPLVPRYFTDYGSPDDVKQHEEIMYSEKGRFLMAHNGWVMDSDPLKNFAASDSKVYIRRELIAWGDSVKLRYGEKPEDCPFLWNHMRQYVEQTAKIFDGVRLDNCHSTPIPVAEYLLDCARKIRPDLYVVAELFTNSDLTDNIFVNRLGITSLIREAMSAWDSHEQGRLVYRYGGCPVGSFYQPRIRPLVPSVAHALFLDLTHDNPSSVERRSVFDLLPSSGLVNMACCASGSNRGYDELVPHHIHVVDETRLYSEWTEDENLAMGNLRYVTRNSGIISAKKALNNLHFKLGAEGFNQVYVDQIDLDIVAVTRHCPETHVSYILVAFTAFGHPPEEAGWNQRGIKPLKVEGVLDEIVLEASLRHVSESKYKKFENFAQDANYINGLSEYRVKVKENIQPAESDIFELVNCGGNSVQLNFKNFKPGSIAVIRVSLPEDMSDAVKNVRNLISKQFSRKDSELAKIISEMSLPDLNRALYRCDQEERDEGYGFDTYDIPNFGRMVYAGLQGFMSLLSNIRPNNDLGHPMCCNLRDGDWMIDYVWKRLKFDAGTRALGQWFEENSKSLKTVPRYLIPCYFDVILTGIYVLLLEQSHNLMSDFVKNGSTFVKALALGSVQFGAYIKSANLPALSPNLAEPQPPARKNENGESVQSCVTLSAGLPHFAVGYMRNWGRDTFIALRGLFLLTGRYQEARYHILGYAACLRHGLIPNLLDGGRNSRFNCRDAVWWWLYCIKCYVQDAPNGISILSDKVSRIFPKDDSEAQAPGKCEQVLSDVMQEALSVHFQGLIFTERNAGRSIDEHMSEKGFTNQIGIHPETGFVFGGNGANCGTWMDKMGSSDKAGNRGKPATPRDGSAVELVGLEKAVISWLAGLHDNGQYAHLGVERTQKYNGSDIVISWSFKDWAEKIQNNFEKYFYVNTSPVSGEIRPDLINKRGIYKDSHGASQEWTDFQLRCNFPIAIVVAPELFDAKHAWAALAQAEKYLLGPLGMKTLDPEDWAYNGDYNNADDSENASVAQGFNYHQGPEWVWPVGFYLRAKLQFAQANGELEQTIASTKIVLSKHFTELQTSAWRGLPELTNKNGAYCNDSSRTQAWSMSCILEVLHDLQKLEKGDPSIN